MTYKLITLSGILKRYRLIVWSYTLIKESFNSAVKGDAFWPFLFSINYRELEITASFSTCLDNSDRSS